MATIRLIPSSYELSSTSYLSVSNANNMYSNTDDNTYATVTNSRTSTTSYYIYLRGFNFSAIPEGSIINSFTVKLKASESGVSTSTSYKPYLANGTSAINGSCSPITTSVQTLTFSGISADWETISGYGANFGIRINCRRASRNTTGYVYIYGAEILVDYTLPVYYTITAANSSSSVDNVDPAVQEVLEGEEATIVIDAASVDNIIVTDNDVDVTSQLVQHTSSTGGTVTSYPVSYTTGGSINGTYYQQAIGKGSDTSNTTGNDYFSTVQGGSGSTYINYHFDFSEIPLTANITNVSVTVKGHCEDNSQTREIAEIQLYSGSTPKGSSYDITSESDTVITLTPGTWTREELDEAILKFTIGVYGGRISGVTWTVTYTTPSNNPYYWTYTISNVTDDHIILIEDAGVYIPPEEDPTYTYWPITISSINATTDPDSGTTRVVEGSNQTITISPTDPQLTLALDNGVDITSQLQGGTPTNTYSVATASGASYGFNLNSDDYYESTNTGRASSAAVARVTFDLETDCIVTFSYINYAESTYDYGIFGQIDSALGTTYTADSNPYLSCSGSSYNTPNVQTVTYNMSAGSHFIDVKYRKDNYTDDNNDSLQFKVSLEATGAGGDYTYTLNNITEKHSLIFVFGNVSFYYINSQGTNAKLFPDGQQVKLEGDTYLINIVPTNPSATVTLLDNNIDVSSQLEREEGYDKNNNFIVSYKYKISDIQANHNLIISCVTSGTTDILYFKNNSGIYQSAFKVYKKVNGSWVLQSVLSNVFDSSTKYVKG